MSRVKSAFLGSVSSQVFMVVSMLLAMATTPLILKFLDKEEYGLSTILFQIVGYLTMFDFGLGGAIARFLARTRGEEESNQVAINKIISTSFFTYSFLGMLVIAAGIGFSGYIPHFFQMAPRLSAVAVSIALTLSVVIGFQFPLRVFSSIFYAHQRQLLANVLGFIGGLLNLILPIIFLYFGHGLWSFVYTNIIGVAISVVGTIYFMRRYYPFLRIRLKLFDKALLGEMFSFGFFLFLNAIAVQVIFFTDRFYIGSLVSLTAVTVFYLTAKLPEICMNLIFKITDNAYPALVEINSNNEEQKFKTVHQKLLLITVCCSSIAFWIILILGFWFIKLWVGESFFAGQHILVLALVLMLIHTVNHVTAICLNGAGIVKGFTVVSFIEAGINVALSLWLGRKLGIVGILLATIISNSLTSLWFTPYTAIKYMKISVWDYLLKPILLPFTTISFFGIGLFWLCSNLLRAIAVNWFSLITIGFSLALVFVIIAWKLFLKSEFESYIPGRFKKILLV